MSDDNESTMSSDSIAFLEEVKKGKPRKFVMICKGAQIISLVVYKKGNVEKYKKEAKEVGKGQVYFGVVQGKGMDLRFVLARADGFDSAPVKTTILKGYLEESAGLKLKPLFEIVDAAPLALDDSDPLVARFLKLQPQALSACDNHPDRESEITALLKSISTALDQDQAESATSGLEQLESILTQLMPPPSSSSSASTPAKPSEAELTYREMLGTVTADLQRLRLINADIAGRIGKVVTGAEGYAAKGDFTTASHYLLQAAEVIAKHLSEARVSEAKQVVPEGLVKAMVAKFEQAQSRWNAALTKVRARIQPVQDEIQEEYPNTAEGLANILAGYQQELLDALLAGQSAAEKLGVEAAVQQTLEKVQSLRSETASDDVFAYLDECGYPVTAAFQDAFNEVETLLQA